MEKLNIAELLRDCSTGMELDCAIYDGATFIRVDGDEDTIYPIVISTGDGVLITLTKYGQYTKTKSAKCVIFPKGKTTWEGFQIPFKDGDILATDLGSVFYLNTLFNTDERYGCYVGIGGDGSFHICAPFAYKECCGFATEEEKQKLFNAIKENGYKWNQETKTLEKMIKPKFKVGDKIVNKKGDIRIISKIMDDEYHFESGGFILFRDHDYWELTPNKFDITTLKPFESRVLVRSCDDDIWKPAIWGIYNDIYSSNYPYITTYGATCQCIPFEGNEHLLGTTNKCDSYFKTWK